MREFRHTVSGVGRTDYRVEAMQGVSQWNVINLGNANFNQ